MLHQIIADYPDRGFKGLNDVVAFMLNLTFKKKAGKRLLVVVDFDFEDVAEIIRTLYYNLRELVEKGKVKGIMMEIL